MISAAALFALSLCEVSEACSMSTDIRKIFALTKPPY
jgi:hypothetical protein